MNTLKKTAAGTMLGGALLVGGGLGLAHAAPVPEAQAAAGDGMVNVTVSAIGQEIGVIRDVTVANAATLATSVCPVARIESNALTNLDVSGTAPTPCTGMTGLSFIFGQNAQAAESAPQDAESQSAPGQDEATATTPAIAAPGQG